MQMKRVVVFLPSAAVKACDTLATRYGSNRSEVVRLAVAEGMPGAVEALERLRDLRLVEAAGSGAARLWRARGAQKRPGRGRPRNVLDPDRAVSVLLEYGRAVRAAESEISREDVRESLRLHAQVIGVSPDDLEDVLMEVLGQMFGEPQVEPVADPSQPPE
jgi:hypothetical protein